MPLLDVVIDTNVFVHSCNPNNCHFESSVNFLNSLNACHTLLLMDRIFDFDLAKNKSKIFHEYIDKLRPQSLAYYVLANLAATRRIKIVSEIDNQKLRRRIQRIIANKRDRTFVFVALNSTALHLISHDEMDFTEEVVNAMANEHGLIICSAGESVSKL